METGFNFNVADPIDMKYVHSPLRILMPAGSIALWDKRLAHGSVPNDSLNGRLIQFMVAQPKNSIPELAFKNRTTVLKKIFHKNGF